MSGLSDAALQEHLIVPVAGEETTPLPTNGQAVIGLRQPLAAGSKAGEYTIIERREEEAGQRVYRAGAPPTICHQCGTRAPEGESRYCEECGAELLPYDVLLYERESGEVSEPTGPWRLVDLPADPIRALLPPVAEFADGGRRYLVTEQVVPGFQSLAELLAAQGASPGQPAALEPVDALPLAQQLARLLVFLHEHGTALGDLSLAQVLIGARHSLRLRDAGRLVAITPDREQADLGSLAQTLEEMTRTPRQTVKLDVSGVAAEGAATLDQIIMHGRLGAFADARGWVAALDALAAQERAVTPLLSSVGSRTDVGRHRPLNEDSFLVQESRIGVGGSMVNAGAYIVADGMGGHESGEVASRLAALAAGQVLTSRLAELGSGSPGVLSDASMRELVVEAAAAANRAVYDEGQKRHNDMGTTLTLALVVGDRCVIGNVGDSRTYRLHAGQLQRVTQDHSLVMRLVSAGQITEDEIYTHPHRNAILRSLGEKPEVEVDTFPVRLEAGDGILLCSDGLWELVRNPRMNEVINGEAPAQQVVEQLVGEANANGGDDNITAVLVRFGAITPNERPA
ncbi:MAG: Stp1/IreP family PP2C-type Ser/Thr phosphatase [Herpetosiphon sp.]